MQKLRKQESVITEARWKRILRDFQSQVKEGTENVFDVATMNPLEPAGRVVSVE